MTHLNPLEKNNFELLGVETQTRLLAAVIRAHKSLTDAVEAIDIMVQVMVEAKGPAPEDDMDALKEMLRDLAALEAAMRMVMKKELVANNEAVEHQATADRLKKL